MTPLPLILASSSPRRQELLASLGVTYHIVTPQIDETQHPGELPLDYVRRLAETKARTVIAKQAGDVAVIAADTIVVLAADTIGITGDGEILGKPASAAEARSMLRRLRNRPHRVCTAFTLMMAGSDYHHAEIVCTTVTMRDYTDAEIEAYIRTGDPFDKAGSYAIQHPEFAPVAHIDGSYTNVVGLPLDEVREALRRFGYAV